MVLGKDERKERKDGQGDEVRKGRKDGKGRSGLGG